VAARGEEIRGRDGLAERGDAEAVKVIEGGHGSPFGRMIRDGKSEWHRVAPG
jgi:hypothetical protein